MTSRKPVWLCSAGTNRSKGQKGRNHRSGHQFVRKFPDNWRTPE